MKKYVPLFEEFCMQHINEENLLDKGEYREAQDTASKKYDDDLVVVAEGDGYKLAKRSHKAGNVEIESIDIYIDKHLNGNEPLISIYIDPYNGETVAGTGKLKNDGSKLYDAVVNLCTKNKEFMADLSSAAKSAGVSINKPNDLLNLIGRNGNADEYAPDIDKRLSDYRYLKGVYKKDNLINKMNNKRKNYEDTVNTIKRQNGWGDSINAQTFRGNK